MSSIIVELKMTKAKIVHVDNERVLLEINSTGGAWNSNDACEIRTFRGPFADFDITDKMLGNRMKSLHIGVGGGKELW